MEVIMGPEVYVRVIFFKEGGMVNTNIRQLA